MSPRKADPYEFKCPACGAEPGKRCNAAAAGGGVAMATWTHAARDVMTKYRQKLRRV